MLDTILIKPKLLKIDAFVKAAYSSDLIGSQVKLTKHRELVNQANLLYEICR